MATLNKNSFLIKLSDSPQTSFGKLEFEQQTPAQKVFSSIWAVESEVSNGGFAQYFSNQSAETVNYVVRALKEIKAPKTATICGNAIRCVFPKGLPSTVQEIYSSAEKIDQKMTSALEKLDDKFLEYPHDLTELLYDFVVSHPEEFAVTITSKKRPTVFQRFLSFFNFTPKS
jgi:hypothetical protein